ncbi:tetratricopeptide repeat protein [Sulfurivermis fontis]|uniref:tetratricopeptide repeat protein n=1 Tax=Sulfurivermis fontis TaxID=1972068 RepID=UPI000FD9B9B1|nr:tetratricopeptide repeat protein [Sulfurivermis fontis]
MSTLPSAMDDWLRQGVQRHQAGDFAAAEFLYRQILAAQPNHGEALHLLGLVHYARGDLAAAAQQIRAAVAAAPHTAVFHFNLGNVLRDAGALEQAITSYRQAVDLQPEEADYHNNLGQACEEAGNLAAAISCYQKAVELAPQDAIPWLNLALALQQQGRGSEAVTAYGRVLQLQPQHALALNNLGTLMQAADDFDGAMRCYQAALQADPALAEAHRNYGGLLAAAGERDGALHHYCEALRLKPDYSEVAYMMAALRGATPPAAAPGEYVAALFDQYADDFDEHLAGMLGYRTPTLLRELFERCGGGRDLQVLDLGCGTGLAGMAFRDVAAHLAGVDLSPRMLDKARERAIYDVLEVGEAVATLRALASPYDLLLAADVFVYLGDLAPVFAAARRALRRDGRLLFSVERGAVDTFVLCEAGRYAHGAGYVRALARQHGFVVLAEEAAVLRQNLGVDVPGWLFVLQKL